MSGIPYSNAVGSIMYVMVCTRPDISHAVSVVSRYMSEPGRQHWEALKWILRYLKGAADYGIQFRKSDDDSVEFLKGYVDSDYAANLDNRRSQTGYVFTLFGAAISWRSMLQPVVALSTTEAEFMAMTEAVKEAIWLKGILDEFGLRQLKVRVLCDSQGALHLVKHQVFHDKSKHIDVKLHYVKDVIEKGDVEVQKVSTKENAADMLTKALPSDKFRYCLDLIQVMQFE